MQSGVHSMSSDPPRLPTGLKNDEGPDILKIRHKGQTYNLYFTSFTISDGILRISDIKSHASQKLNIHSGRLSLLYKGRKLIDDHRAAREYDLKHNSEILGVIVEPTEVDREWFEPPDSKRDNRLGKWRSVDPAFWHAFPDMSRATSRRKPAGFDPSIPGDDEPMAPRTSAYTINSSQEPAYPTPGIQYPRTDNVAPIRRSNLKHAEVHDSGYGSDGGHTPDLPGTNPSKAWATRDHILEEDEIIVEEYEVDAEHQPEEDEVTVEEELVDAEHQPLTPESHHPQTRSPSLYWQQGRRDQPQINEVNILTPLSRPMTIRPRTVEDEDDLATIGRQEPFRKTGLAERTGSSTKPEPVKKPEMERNDPEVESDQRHLNATKSRKGKIVPDADDPAYWAAGTFDILKYIKAYKSHEEKTPEARDQDEADRIRDIRTQDWAQKLLARGRSGSQEEEHRTETNNRSITPPLDGIGQQTAKDQLVPPEQPARPRSAPAFDFHSNATKAFQEDVFVWSSVTRDFTATLASVDTQSDRNLVYLGFLENDLRVEYKKYGDGEATPLRSLAGNVWPLGWAMLKIFPVRVNPKSGIRERHRPQYVVFDVYDTTTFGDLLLGNEYAEGNDVCNFLMKGSRKANAQTEALRKQREEEFRRFEAENGQQAQNSQTSISTNASVNSARNASA